MTMRDNEKTQLNAAAVEVFGTMYYTPIELLTELPAADSWHLDPHYIKAEIGYHGPVSAVLCFYFPRRLAISIAGGFLGTPEEEIVDSQLIDTMREAANMIVGNFLGRIDQEGTCTLGIPAAEVVAGFSPEARPGEEIMAFVSDFGLLWLVHR